MTGVPSAERLARDLDWNLLRTFPVALVTDAANRLGLKQPSVSSALKRLEDRLGKKLFDRGPGRFELTAAGRLLQAEATDIHGAILRLGTVMRDIGDEVRGHVSIAMASHVVSPLLDSALSEFHRAHPAATLSIDHGQPRGDRRRQRAPRLTCRLPCQRAARASAPVSNSSASAAPPILRARG
ncbi:MAG: LysR family transcriptional regulator [Defluviimonas denitrificans]